MFVHVLVTVSASVLASCHLVTIPASANQLSDALMTSPIIGASGNYSGGGSSGGGAHGDFDFGVDPSQDPELAMVSGGIFLISLFFVPAMATGLVCNYSALHCTFVSETILRD